MSIATPRPDHSANVADQPRPTESLARLLKAGGDPMRLEILQVLKGDTFGVLELAQLFEVRQSGMSHHLKVLATAGLVEAQREGNAIFYRRPLMPAQPGPELAIVQKLFDTLDGKPLPDHLATGIEAIREQRAQQSRSFFQRNAEQFRKQQELIAAHDQYAEPVAELIRNRFARTGDRALEIGPGAGEFLPVLAERFERVIAMDNAAEMLDQARETCSELDLDNIRLVLGESPLTCASEGPFDVIVANMVLHHVPSPTRMLKEAREMLAPGGRLVISDLCRHEQTWVRENCGDLWQGFAPEELTEWGRESGLRPLEQLFIGLRNGFQIQVREFVRDDDPRPAGT